MRKDYLKITLAIIPTLVTCVGVVAWLTTLRNDVNTLLTKTEDIHQSSEYQEEKIDKMVTDVALVKQALGIKDPSETALIGTTHSLAN